MQVRALPGVLIFMESITRIDEEKLPKRLYFNHFFEKEIKVALPIINFGELYFRSCETPAVWCLDSKNVVWLKTEYEEIFRPTTKENVIKIAETFNEKQELRKIFGLPLKEPEWMTIAKENGWEPKK